MWMMFAAKAVSVGRAKTLHVHARWACASSPLWLVHSEKKREPYLITTQGIPETLGRAVCVKRVL